MRCNFFFFNLIHVFREKERHRERERQLEWMSRQGYGGINPGMNTASSYTNSNQGIENYYYYYYYFEKVFSSYRCAESIQIRTKEENLRKILIPG